MTMVAIGFDRYNVIVKGFSGTKITAGKATAILAVIWTYGILGCCPPFWGWGGYRLGKQNFATGNLMEKQWNLFEKLQKLHCFLYSS